MKKRITTISLRSSTKKIIEKIKKNYEKNLNRKMSWDEFFLFLCYSEKRTDTYRDINILELNDKEAKILQELLERGRESWKRHVSTQVS